MSFCPEGLLADDVTTGLDDDDTILIGEVLGMTVVRLLLTITDFGVLLSSMVITCGELAGPLWEGGGVLWVAGEPF